MSCKIDGMCKSAAACFLGGCIYDEKPVTENNVEAQAGDEPIRAALQTVDTHLKCAIEHIDAGQLDRAKLCIETSRRTVQSVSPRATADVERDAARYRWLLRNSVDESTLLPWPIVDWMRGWPIGKPELDEAIDAAIATTKPGA